VLIYIYIHIHSFILIFWLVVKFTKKVLNILQDLFLWIVIIEYVSLYACEYDALEQEY
jgi:hypothetical protein